MPAVAFLPHPPALFPELTGGPLAEFESTRRAVDEALRRVLADRPGAVWIVGAGPAEHWYGAGSQALRTAGGALAGFTADVPADGAGTTSELPTALAVGAWLLDRVGYSGERAALAVPAGADAAQLDDLAAELTGAQVLLVMGDGSAMRADDAPGSRHPEAVGFDDLVATALRVGDSAALAALDPDLGMAVRAAGVPAWRLAGRLLAGRSVRAELLDYRAPFGVGYLVATWTDR
ncbi:MAG: hypothetical protein ACR2KN_08890 [Geodermatophilaceae bacterium]